MYRAELYWPLEDLKNGAGEDEIIANDRLVRNSIRGDVEEFIKAYKGLPLKPVDERFFNTISR